MSQRRTASESLPFSERFGSFFRRAYFERGIFIIIFSLCFFAFSAVRALEKSEYSPSPLADQSSPALFQVSIPSPENYMNKAMNFGNKSSRHQNSPQNEGENYDEMGPPPPPPADNVATENVTPLDEAIAKAKAAEAIPLNQPLFVTEDQVILRGTYYKGNASDSTVPVILLHDMNGKKEDMAPLAEKLAEKGMAVLVPDLRGHGESTQAQIEDYSAGGDRPFIRQSNSYRVDSFTETDFEGMQNYDGLLWFQFLVWLHNEKMINLRSLVIIGNGFGGSIGAYWVLNDWKIPGKKGHFSKGLFLISPEEDPVYKKLGDSKAKPGSVHYEIFLGNLNKEKLKAAQNIGLELGHDKSSTPEEERKVPLQSFKTEKQGLELLDIESFGILSTIIEAIEKDNSSDSSSRKWQPIKHFMDE